MTAELFFGTGSQLAMIGWLILIFLPRRWGIIWIPHYVIPGVLSIGYAAMIMPSIYTVDGGGFGSIEQVRTLMSDDRTLTAGWLHYLAFDLFIGAWIAVQCDRARISRLIQLGFFLPTFMFGPVGLALFLITRGMMAGVKLRKGGIA